MTGDEAFIRAVVGNPGDDTPRLVYADWLDDRNDPRGAYLRAEREWAATHDPGERETLRQIAKGLDPLWVARVSRPPAGVCCEHLAKSKGERNVGHGELDAAASELGVSVPAQLQALLLNYNLGHLRGGPFVLPARGDRPWIPVLEFAHLNGQDPNDSDIGEDLIERTFYMRQQYEYPQHLLYLASGTQFEHFMVSATSKAGAVYLIRDSDTYLHENGDGAVRFANTVGEFLHRLEPRSYPLDQE